jgi:hypothetical protein
MEKNNQSTNTFITETICTNCKGKGSTLGVKLKAIISGIGTIISGLIIWNLTESSLYGFFGFVLMIGGLVQMYLAKWAKCPVCKGTGIVKLNVEQINPTSQIQEGESNK